MIKSSNWFKQQNLLLLIIIKIILIAYSPQNKKTPNNSPNMKVTTGNKSPGNVSSSTHMKKNFGFINKNSPGGSKVTSPNFNKNSPINRVLGDKTKSISSSEVSSLNKFQSDVLNSNISKPDSARASLYSKFDNASVPMPISNNAPSGSISPQLPASTTPNFSNQSLIHSSSIEEGEDKITSWNPQETMSKNNANESNEKAGVSSSSDIKASTSTPSSPAEIIPIADAFQKTPPLIPIDCIEDQNEDVSEEQPAVECEPSIEPCIDSSECVEDLVEATSSEVFNSSSSIEPLNEVSTSVNVKEDDFEDIVDSGTSDQSSSVQKETQVSASKSNQAKEKDDDNDGLVIDDSVSQTKQFSSSSNSIQEAVSSSTNSLSSQTVSAASPISSTFTTPNVTAISGSISSAPQNVPATTAPSPSPSNLSTVSSMQRPSPYPIGDIDDELMDEALIGSGE